MTTEETERLERALILGRFLVNVLPGTREQLEKHHGQVWDTNEMCRDFEVLGFNAPFVVVKRKSIGKIGSLMFQHHERFYWGWVQYDGPPLSTLRHDDDLPGEPPAEERERRNE